jgi:hypothetical protein
MTILPNAWSNPGIVFHEIFIDAQDWELSRTLLSTRPKQGRSCAGLFIQNNFEVSHASSHF